ncbi:hypothetical protein [Flavobacterium ichthyis]|nr:hypothetical protein [Flavobacterium ichthyis]
MTTYHFRRKTHPNRRLAQWRVKWLIENSASHQLLWCIDSFLLRNPPLRQAPKRYTPFPAEMTQIVHMWQDTFRFAKTFSESGNDRITGVWQDCEFCSKFTFTFRKKFYL